MLKILSTCTVNIMLQSWLITRLPAQHEAKSNVVELATPLVKRTISHVRLSYKSLLEFIFQFIGMTYKHADQETLSLAQHAQGRKNVYQSTFKDTKANQTEEADDTTSTDEHLDARDTIDCENEDWYFSTKRLKPENRLKPAQRRLLLRNSGLVNIDRNEANSCKEIRDSRRHSGCNCKRICEPETCSCILAGIPCFVEDERYPCSCNMIAFSNVQCKNPSGHVQYCPYRVRDHYIRTMKKIELDHRAELAKKK